ncbi:hypothetical protein BO71DRAFT_424583 [Aspergillus ellipticus CBS 707.79]|uniref:Uncharacterized protein n=1 Tax=Aspergillus ellipticus CBS 707.79 TaxID=1448320 RepID=A0A319F4Z3_9EURO|nr:hypothetical protein BO71DRAFT_424583 [Aspergillus ellipticus CBS 707.79]
MIPDAEFLARIEPSRKTRNENPWLNGLGFDEEDLQALRNIQNTYLVQLDDHPDLGYAFRIWMLWDYDRLWGIFDLGHTKGIFLVDPGVNLSLPDHDDGCQELPFTWRGIEKARPNILLCNELITKGTIRINVWNARLEGYFEFLDGNGSPGMISDNAKCAFHAKSHFGPSVVPYTLQDTVEEWNEYLPLMGMEDSVRQFLCPSELAADLRKRDEENETSTGGNKTSVDDDEEDDLSQASQDSSIAEETVGEVFDNYGRSIQVRFQVDKEGNVVSGRFDGDFMDVFEDFSSGGTPFW